MARKARIERPASVPAGLMFAASTGEYLSARKSFHLSEQLLGGLDVEDLIVRFDHTHSYQKADYRHWRDFKDFPPHPGRLD